MITRKNLLNKVILVGDQHLGVYSNSLDWFNIQKSFFEDFLTPLVDKIITKSNHTLVSVVFMGDMFDNKQKIDTVINDWIIEYIYSLSRKVQVFIIVGNHDSPFRDSIDINTCKSFKYMDNVQLCIEPEVVECVNGEKVLFMSWIEDRQKQLEVIESADAEYLLSHTAYQGFFYDGNTVEGSKYMSQEEVAKFKKIYNAHIHLRQLNNNILNIGTPYHLKPSDHQNECGITVVDFDSGKEYYVENKISPRYKQINIFKLLNMKQTEANEFVKNSFITVLCPSDLFYKLNSAKITEQLSGYKTIDYKSYNEIYKENVAIVDKSITMESAIKNVELEEKIPEYLNQAHVVKIDKMELELTPVMREQLSTELVSLCKEVKETMTYEEINI